MSSGSALRVVASACATRVSTEGAGAPPQSSVAKRPLISEEITRCTSSSDAPGAAGVALGVAAAVGGSAAGDEGAAGAAGSADGVALGAGATGAALGVADGAGLAGRAAGRPGC